MKSVNPATDEMIREYIPHTNEQVDEILEQVHTAFSSWKTTSFGERSTILNKAAKELRKDAEKYATLMTREMGKPIKEARGEVEKCAWVCEYYAENAEKMLADEPAESDGSKAFVAFEPVGTVLAVMPWNFPLWQVFRFAAPALMAGNTAILKHASNVPGCALAIEEIFIKAGLPKNVFRTLLISSKQVAPIIENDIVKAVTLTGSEPAGASVASTAAKVIKKSVLELGGADPFIVLEDVDIDTCAENAVKGRLLNTGQSCIAAKRFIIAEKHVEAFTKKFKGLMEAKKMGDPLEESTDVGPLARPEFVDDIHELVEDAIKKGATVVTGGKKPEGKGSFYPPTIVAGVTKGMRLYEEETFGPVATVITAKDVDHAIEIANSSRFGLGGSLWTNDTEQGIKLARRVESGAVFVNGITKSDPRLPFGGIKKSGYGRELSHFGIKEFINVKTIWVA